MIASAPRDTEILILGAGLQGAGIALELARHGIPTTLVERDPVAINRASLRNEGKIHLGFIYANDASGETARMQLAGAVRFGAIVTRWLAPGFRFGLSTPFHYLVARDSIVAPEALATHYASVEQHWREHLAADPDLDYLGERPERLVRPLTPGEIAAHFDPARFAAGFATRERAIDTDALARAVRAAIDASPAIRFAPEHEARALVADGDGFTAEGDGPHGPWRVRARQVVNATWEQRLGFDHQLGIAPPSDLLHRLKYRVVTRLTSGAREGPSVSMVLGRYGDVVIREDGTAFLSWYPAGLQGWSHELAPPAEWDAPCRGVVDARIGPAIARGIRDGIAAWYPALEAGDTLTLDAGAIVALGRRDVDDASSGLHDRTRIGVTSHGGYHSVDPGKLTTAPVIALETAARVIARRDRGAHP